MTKGLVSQLVVSNISNGHTHGLNPALLTIELSLKKSHVPYLDDLIGSVIKIDVDNHMNYCVMSSSIFWKLLPTRKALLNAFNIFYNIIKWYPNNLVS